MVQLDPSYKKDAFFKIDPSYRWYKGVEKNILELVDYNPSAKVLDLGCGIGETTLKIKERIGCKKIIGVDIWDESIAEAEKKGIPTIKHDLNIKLPFDDGSFDLVHTNQVIEHLWYPISFLQEIKRVLTDDGIIILSTENLSSWDNLLALFFGWTPFSVQFDYYVKVGNPISPLNNKICMGHHTHTRIFTYYGIKHAIQNVGFKIDNIKGSGYVPLNILSKIDLIHSRFLTIRAMKC